MSNAEKIMNTARLIAVISALLLSTRDTLGHGRLEDPPSRSSAWRFEVTGAVRNDDDTGLNCGFVPQDKAKGIGNCGVCGDPFGQPSPRENERTGKYGKGMVFKPYARGSTIQVRVRLTTFHKGHFEFSVCQLRGPLDIETENCFKQLMGRLVYPYGSPRMAEKIPLPPSGSGDGMYVIQVQLPTRLQCDYCSLRWEYTAGNNWGMCSNRIGQVGCGAQETFRNCADISIR